jgi:hypothetical protein
MRGVTEKLAAVRGADSATIQALFEAMVARWRKEDVRVVGLIEETYGLTGRTCNAGILRDIVSGERHSIYLEIPPADSSCHIDAAGAASAGAALLGQIKTADLVVLSKFGKLEAAGGGLIGAFEAALDADKPVLTSVSDKHLEAWHDFAPKAATLRADTAALQDWWRAVRHPAELRSAAG